MSNWKGFVLILLGLTPNLMVNAQFEDITTCASDEEFLVDVIGCLMAKFLPLLELELPIFYNQNPEENHEYIGRHLLFTHADDAIRKNNLPKMMNKLATKHEGLMGNFAAMTNDIADGIIRSDLLPRIKRMNVRDVGLDLARHLAKNLVSVRDRSILYRRILSSFVKDLDTSFLDLEKLKESQTSYTPTPYLDICEIFGEGPLCDLYRMGLCLDGYPEEAFEDGIDDLPPLATCMAEAFNKTESCRKLTWLKNLILRIFVDIVQLDDCYFKVNDISGVTVDNPILLEEGADPHYFEFRTYLPPGVMCFEPGILDAPIVLIIDVIGAIFNLTGPCDVQIQMSTSNYLYELLPYVNQPVLGIELGRPKCRSDAMINQAAIGWFEHASNYSCTINVTDENWNTTFRVPVVAVVDGKRDGDINLNFTLKMTQGGTTYNSTKVPMRIVDKDPRLVSTCQSLNDPHILTFDGHLYNNLYHGYFHLYKHQTYPYEVQVIFQACGANVSESCNCAAAVRSGDDVFVVDQCHRTEDSCDGDDCHLLKAVLYTNGDITPGTRFFVKNGGLRYDILLPHGTMVRIVSMNGLLNVWVIPSVYDRDNTMGLCGIFNEDAKDDLTFPNGTLYEGDGTEELGQPRPFNKAWRVPEEERIFSGVFPAEEEFVPEEYCKCHHVIIEGVQCTCGYEDLIEYCDLDLSGELTPENISAIVRRSAVHVAALQGDAILLQFDDIDMDEDYEPDDVVWKPGAAWNETAARAFCISYIRQTENTLVERCKVHLTASNVNLRSKAYENCVNDIKITDSTDWALGALESVKMYCVDGMYKLIKLKESDIDDFNNSTCVAECHYNGICLFGECICDDGWMGPDCSIPSGSPLVLMDDSALCDSRYEDCSFATIHGLRFRPSESLKCKITEYKVLEGQPGSHSSEVSTIYINENQLACKLPSSGSYQVTLEETKGLTSFASDSTSFVFMAYDSACYTCDQQKKSCTRKDTKDHCFIKSGCYAPGQIDANDHCSVCNITLATDEWSDIQTDECAEKRADEKAKADADHNELVLRSSIAAGLSALIIIIVVIAFFIDRRRQKSRHELQQSESVAPDEVNFQKNENEYTAGSFHGTIQETELGTEASHESKAANGSTQIDEHHSHDNPALEMTDEAHLDRTTRVSAECADVLRVKEAVARERTYSQGSNHSQASVSSFFRLKNVANSRIRTTSASSTGMGGGGPTHLSGHLHSLTDDPDEEVHGIGGYMGSVMTPTGKRKDYEHVPIARF